MINIHEKTVNYFAPPAGYFWKWAEKGDVIEWSDGRTLCFRTELSEVLAELEPYGWLPLGTILMVIAACKSNFEQDFDRQFFDKLPEELAAGDPNFSKSTDSFVRRSIDEAEQFLERIHRLPDELKSPVRRLHLLTELTHFTKNTIPPEVAKMMLVAFDPGKLDHYMARGSQKSRKSVLLQDVHCLREAEKHFRSQDSADALAIKLKTSVYDLPQPAELEVPPAATEDVLAQLRADARTENLARLTQQLLAAFHIPIHSQGSSDQPLGGVSDISNRGNFDRLLLSELAHDDLSLMACLVNNEALYLQRETPPQQLPQARRVLVDTSLRMWGTHRIYAIAAALACVYKAPEQIETRVFAGQGIAFEEVDFSQKEGVMEGLANLSGELESHQMVLDFLRQYPATAQQETIFITDDAWMRRDSARVTEILALQGLSYLISLSRNGGFELFQFQQGRRKRLSHAQLDLDRSLFAAPDQDIQLKRTSALDLPLFYHQDKLPLYFPTMDMGITSKNFFPVGKWGFVGITKKYRLLYWMSGQKGAQEFFNQIEQGPYCFGYDSDQYGLLLLYNYFKEKVKIYIIDFADENAFSKEINIPTHAIHNCVFYQGKFYLLHGSQEAIVIDPFEQGYKMRSGSSLRKVLNHPYPTTEHSLSYLKRQINKGYNVYSKPDQLRIGGNRDRYLLLGSRYLQPRLKIEEAPGYMRKNFVEAKLIQRKNAFDNLSVSLSYYEWPDGSQAIVDTRGFLHLKSADPEISEVSIVMVLGKISAAWVANENLHAGSDYFARPTMGKVNRLNELEFYRSYIQPFINHIHQHVTPTQETTA